MTEAERFTGLYALLSDFYGALDDGTSAEAAALFLPEGTWMRQGQLLTGPQEVREALDERPANRDSLHLFSNLRITEAGEGSASVTYGLHVNTGLRAEGGRIADSDRVTAAMVCKDRAVHTPEGWRFLSREASVRFR